MLVSWRRVLQTALADWFWKHKNLGRVLNCAKLVQYWHHSSSLCCCVSQCDVTSRTVLFCLTNPKDSSEIFRVCQWWNSLKGVCTFLSFPLSLHSLTLGNWRTDPWHQPWCTLHVWISFPSNSATEFGRNLGDAQIGDMEASTLPLLFTSKKAPSPWNFHGEGHLSAPDLGLASSNLPCDSRMRARTFTEISVLGWLAPSCASRPASTLCCSSSAWRLEVAPLRRYKLAT